MGAPVRRALLFGVDFIAPDFVETLMWLFQAFHGVHSSWPPKAPCLAFRPARYDQARLLYCLYIDSIDRFWRIDHMLSCEEPALSVCYVPGPTLRVAKHGGRAHLQERPREDALEV